MSYLSDLAVTALMSTGNKRFTIQDGHEMTITPVGDGKTMNIDIDDGMSYQTKGVNDFVKKIGIILKNRSVTGWADTREGQDSIGQVLSMYKDDECTADNIAYLCSCQCS